MVTVDISHSAVIGYALLSIGLLSRQMVERTVYL